MAKDRQDRLARQPDMQSGQVLVGIEAANHLRLHNRMITPVRHVLFARPDELHRRTRHLFGDQDGLRHVIAAAAAAEAAAEDRFIHVALRGWETGGFHRRAKRRFAILGAGPDLTLVRCVERGRVQRLHAGIILIGIAVDRFHLLHRACERGLGIAVRVADERLRSVEAFLQPCGNQFARNLGIFALVPNDRQRVERSLGLPPGIGHHRDGGIVDAHDLPHARHAGHFEFVEALEVAAEYRASLDCGVEHAWELHIHPVDHFTDHFSAVSSRLSGLPAIVQSLGSLSLIPCGTSSLEAASATLP